MRYFGSKVSTVDKVYDLISTRVRSGSFCDAFGGIGTVGSYFKARGYSVWTSDILVNAYYFQVARVKLNRIPSFTRLRKSLKLQRSEQIADFLNRKRAVDGWLTREYGASRRFFTPDNAGRIEACRVQINTWVEKGLVTEEERAILLASLINSMDRVANTAGTYYAYLKTWHRKAVKPFRFEFLRPTYGTEDCRCFLSNARDLVGSRKFDVLYLDPPFNERCFSSYYHLPESIARCEAPSLRGQSGVPLLPRPKSDFNRPKQAAAALEQLLDNARFKLLVFHYADNGLIPKTEIRRLLRTVGKIEEFRIDSKGYTTLSNCRTIEHRLYMVHNG